jgi:hypothetical protein
LIVMRVTAIFRQIQPSIVFRYMTTVIFPRGVSFI